jgi:hypothetical protein
MARGSTVTSTRLVRASKGGWTSALQSGLSRGSRPVCMSKGRLIFVSINALWQSAGMELGQRWRVIVAPKSKLPRTESCPWAPGNRRRNWCPLGPSPLPMYTCACSTC